MQTAKQPKIEWRASEAIELVRVRAGRHVTAMVGGMVASYYVHWVVDQKRTQACVLGNCPHCRAFIPRRPMTYCEAMTFRLRGETFQWLPAILEVPWAAGVTLGQMGKKVVALKRERACGPVNIGTFLFDHGCPNQVHFELVPHLMRMWGIPPQTQLALVGNLGPDND